MYSLVASKRFRKQVAKFQKANPLLLKKLEMTIETLRLGKALSVAHKDHKLIGQLSGFRECHMAPDWLLICHQHNELLILELLSTGSHSTLFE